MLIKKNNNKGFTLVEVIVSMLVLSITIVSVLSAFVYAAKSNTLTKKKQTAEALLEDLVEYTNAYSKEFDPETKLSDLGRYVDMFGGDCAVTTEFSDSNDVEVSKITGITEGSNQFDIRITRDRNPSEYASGSVNNTGAITFGESGTMTVMVNADLQTYDSDRLDYYFEAHEEAVETHNLEEYDANAADPTYEPNLKTAYTKGEVANKMTREIWLEFSETSANKVRLVAYAVYNVPTDNNQFYLKDEIERQWKEDFFTSPEIDVNTTQLKQIYVLYKKSSLITGTTGVNIRILDKTGSMGTGKMDANIFIAQQLDGLADVDTIYNTELENRYPSGSKVYVSFRDNLGNLYTPARADVYCSTEIQLIAAPTTAKAEGNTLVAKNNDLRIVTVKIEVLDPETDQVLAQTKDAIACLQ